MNQIIINNSNELLNTLLAHICLEVQGVYDISPTVIEQVISTESLKSDMNFVYKQSKTHMINTINQFTDQYQKISAVASSPETLPSENRTSQAQAQLPLSELEKCGHVVDRYPNGYLVYCNKHKYLHSHSDSSDHRFVQKTYEQMIKERHHNGVYIIYTNFVNHLYHKLHSLFSHYLNNLYYKQTIHINDVVSLIEQMRQNPYIFKKKLSNGEFVDVYYPVRGQI